MSRIDYAILGGLVGSLVSVLGVRLMNVRWRHRTQAGWVGRDMVLRQPPIRSWLGVGVIASIPLVLGIATITRGPSNPVTPPMIAILLGSGLAVGALGWAMGRRTVTVSSDAIELHGLFGRRIVWSGLAAVDALHTAPHRELLVFRDRNGKAIAVDSTYYGWEEFLEKVSEIAPEAGSKVARAMKRLETSP